MTSSQQITELSHLETKETKPIDNQHLLTRRLIQHAIRHCPHGLYATLDRPPIATLPREATEYCMEQFAATEPNLHRIPFQNFRAFLLNGIADTFTLLEAAHAHRHPDRLQDVATSPDTISSLAFLAKHDSDALYRALRDPLAIHTTPDGGVRVLETEPPSLEGGCPEVSAERQGYDIATTPTRLFGKFAIWSGQLYTAAHQSVTRTEPLR